MTKPACHRPSRDPRLLALCAAVSLTAGAARGQLVPDRTYCGIGRPIPMTAGVPADLKVSGEATITLFARGSADPKGTAPVAPGRVDLAEKFPSLWATTTPRTGRDVLYAQLIVGQQRIGPPVVLQPMVEPDTCVYIDERGEPQYRPSRGFYSGLRAYTDKQVVMETTFGTIQFQMRPDQAPNTAWNFMDLVRGGFYTDISLHRIVAVNESNQMPFVIQGGDPNFGHSSAGVGEGGPGYQIDLEKSNLLHAFGVISMARSMKAPNSAGSQFFICLSREGTSHLDGQFTAFGQAVAGADVIQKISTVTTDKEGHPNEPVVIKSCRLVDAPPYGEGPDPVTPPVPPPVKR